MTPWSLQETLARSAGRLAGEPARLPSHCSRRAARMAIAASCPKPSRTSFSSSQKGGAARRGSGVGNIQVGFLSSGFGIGASTVVMIQRELSDRVPVYCGTMQPMRRFGVISRAARQFR